MRKLFLSLLWLPAMGGGHVVAAAEQTTLPPMVITATRTSVSEDRVIAPITVIERDDLERSMAPDVAELLRFQGGIEVARNGGPGQVTSVFIRGAESDQTLVLLDGVRLNSGTSGLAAIQNVSPDLIERIEIVKGPRSSLYGTEAVGGVINIITRGSDDATRLNAGAGGGRYDTRFASGGTRFAAGPVTAGVNVSWYDTDGFPTLEASDDDAGYDNLSFDLWSKTGLGPVDVDVRHWQADGTTQYADFFLAPVEQHFTNKVSRVSLSAAPAAGWETSLSIDRNLDEIDQGQGAFDPSDFTRTERYSADWQNVFHGPGDLQVVAGLFASREQTSGQIFGSPLEEDPGAGHVNIDVDAGYLETSLTRGRQQALAAMRRSDHQIFGSQNSWNLEYGLDITRSLRLTAGAGKAFRAPTSLDLYGFGGNPDLDPEVSHEWDVALAGWIGGRHQLRAGVFRNRIDDLIEFVFTDPDSFQGENRNVDKAEIEGLELSYRYRGDLWKLRAEITLQDPRNKVTDEKLLRRADEFMTVAVARQFGAHDFGLDVLAAGPRRDFGGARLAGYVLANLTSRFRLGEHWEIKAKVENLLDQDYQLADGYRSAGRGVYAALAYSH